MDTISTSLNNFCDISNWSNRKRFVVIMGIITSCVVVGCITAYIFVGNYILDGSYPRLQVIDMHGMSVNISNNSFQVTTSIQLTFDVPRGIRAYPEMGTFDLTAARLDGGESVRASSKSMYEITEEQQIISLHFQAYMQEQPVMDLQRKLWVRVMGHFKMRVKLLTLPGFPKSDRDLYFLCEVALRGSPDRIAFKTCLSSHDPYSL